MRCSQRNYGANAAWFSALKGDSAAVDRFAEATLSAASQNKTLSAVIRYFQTEADLDRFRSGPVFKAILARYDGMLKR